MSELCRICGESSLSGFLTSVFGFKKNRLIVDLIHLFCPIKIDPSDPFSKKICKKCLRIIVEANELREKSVHSDIKFKSQRFMPQIVEAVSIKHESEDPIEKVVVFESDRTRDDDDDDETYSMSSEESEVFPVKPSSKFEVIYNRYKCPNCTKAFSNEWNCSRHVKNDHKGEEILYKSNPGEKEPPKEKKIWTCHVCGLTFGTSQSNMNRHIKKFHPEHYQSTPMTHFDRILSKLEDGEIIEPPEEVTVFFNTASKMKYLKFIECKNPRDNYFDYYCRICSKQGIKKSYTQKLDGGTGNIRRHLLVHHRNILDEFEKKN